METYTQKNKITTKKQKFNAHLNGKIEGEKLLIEALEKILINFEKVKHYKKIDKRFLNKLMEDTPQKEYGEGKKHDIFFLTFSNEWVSLKGRNEYWVDNSYFWGEEFTERKNLIYNDLDKTFYTQGEITPENLKIEVSKSLDIVKSRLKLFEEIKEKQDEKIEEFNKFIDEYGEIVKKFDAFGFEFKNLLGQTNGDYFKPLTHINNYHKIDTTN
jgi:hypothetical protein